jgi:hypothetical protein
MAELLWHFAAGLLTNDQFEDQLYPILADITDADSLQKRRWLDGMVRFTQSHGRMPKTKEDFKSAGFE